MGEKSPCNSILNSKRISSPRDPRSPNQPSVSTPPLRRQQLRGARQSPLRQNGCPHGGFSSLCSSYRRGC
ncbi:60S ribosomal protein L18a-2 [Zea mays]|uniref:60S ribosomal protein L18a-2 n=1 Tax=Zea mays TaxID=4577 RepID=A0A1D6F573_MAIZE|nr:60S ribosomal protein L18a-2 [Zea mays]